jgi:hypothetical protein
VQIWTGEQIGPHTWALGATDADWTSIENSVTEPHSLYGTSSTFRYPKKLQYQTWLWYFILEKDCGRPVACEIEGADRGW